VYNLVRAIFVTPAYLSVAWTLMVGYQLFTQTAVTTVVTLLGTNFPVLEAWLTTRIDMIVFVYAFAWVFVLSSIIPSIILGKERSVLVQFMVCLAITLTSFVILDAIDPTVLYSASFLQIFTNPIFASVYLSLPYIVMLAIDLRGRQKKKASQKIAKLTDNYLSNKI
jgi:hypothetical protein